MATIAEVEKLVEAATSDRVSSYERRRAISELAEISDRVSAETLIKLLDDDDAYLRRHVVSEIAKVKGADIVQPLIGRLNDPDEYVQRDAIRALSKLNDARAVEPLQALVGHKSFTIRYAVEEALEDLADAVMPEPAPAPVELVPEEKVIEPPPANLEEAPEKDETKELPEQIQDLESMPVAETEEPEIIEPDVKPSEPEPIEVDDEPSEPEPIETEPVATNPDPIPTPTITESTPRDRAWHHSPRMRIFFGEYLPQVQKAYEQLDQQQRGLHQLESRLREALTKLRLQRADKDDDLARLESDMDALDQEIQRADERLQKVQSEQAKLETQSESTWHKLVSTVMSSKREEHEKRQSDLGDERSGLEQSLQEKREQRQALQSQHDDLLAPVEELQNLADTLAEEKRTHAESTSSADRVINDHLLDVIDRLPSDELESRLDQIRGLASHEGFFRSCIDRLNHARSELSATESQWQTVTEAIEQSARDTESGIAQVSAAIASGFRIEEVQRQTRATLEGNVQFQEQSGFMSGYSGANGTAHGTGTGQANYTLEQVTWSCPEELSDHVSSFAGDWERFGEQIATQQSLSAKRSALARTVAEYIHFLREELQRDFEG